MVAAHPEMKTDASAGIRFSKRLQDHAQAGDEAFSTGQSHILPKISTSLAIPPLEWYVENSGPPDILLRAWMPPIGRSGTQGRRENLQ